MNMPRVRKNNGNGKRLATQQSVDQAVKSICDIMRRGNCAGAMQYVPELTWILFLRILDEKEHREEQETEALGVPFRPSLEAPFRWRDWAAPPETLLERQTNKRVELQNSPQNAFFNFVNTELLPHLKSLKNRPDASPRQKVISEIMTGVERVRSTRSVTFLMCWTRWTSSPPRRWTRHMSSRSLRSMKDCS
jgi:type I restriction enzyme M protein